MKAYAKSNQKKTEYAADIMFKTKADLPKAKDQLR